MRSPLGRNPGIDSIVKTMMEDSERDKGIHVEKISHGKSDRRSLTISLVKTGASGPA